MSRWLSYIIFASSDSMNVGRGEDNGLELNCYVFENRFLRRNLSLNVRNNAVSPVIPLKRKPCQVQFAQGVLDIRYDFHRSILVGLDGNSLILSISRISARLSKKLGINNIFPFFHFRFYSTLPSFSRS